MDNDELLYDILKRVESKVDRIEDSVGSKVGRAELIGWLTLIGGTVALGLGR